MLSGAVLRDAATGAAASAPVRPNVLGCYRLRFDPPVDRHGFPETFRLAHDSATGVNSVHDGGAGGRDSVLNGADWRMMATSVVVSARDARANAVRLVFAPDTLTATFLAAGTNATAKLERTSCPR
jgi:hypothetical protein